MLLIITTGCSCNVPKKAKNYLEKKYNEKFTVSSYVTKSIDVPYDEIFLYAESHPNDIVNVYYKNKEFTDNYYGILVHDDYQELLNNIINEQLFQTKCYFNFTASFFDNSLVDKAKFKKAIVDFKESFFSNIFVFIPESSNISEEDFNKLIQRLKDENIYGYIAIYKLTVEDYAFIAEENYHDFLSQNYLIKPALKETFTN